MSLYLYKCPHYKCERGGYSTTYTQTSSAFEKLGSTITRESTAGDEPVEKVNTGITFGVKLILGFEVKLQMEEVNNEKQDENQ